MSLIRPDACIAWAAAGESVNSATPALREALSRWFGTPEDDGRDLPSTSNAISW